MITCKSIKTLLNAPSTCISLSIILIIIVSFVFKKGIILFFMEFFSLVRSFYREIGTVNEQQ